MNRINRYLLSNFVSSFASLFTVLFAIISIVFFIKIAKITSFIQINSVELLKLYLFMLPRVLIFTAPIAYFVALGTSLFRLSRENESTVIFTFGYPSKKIGSFFLKISFLISSFMLFISIIMMPYADNLKDNFVDYKKTQATLNLKSSEFGQRFGEWLIYIEDDVREGENTIYKDLILYSPKTKNTDERVILAKSGVFRSVDSVFEMKLKDGVVYTIDKSVHITNFESMTIRSKPKDSVIRANTVYDYWAEAKTSDKRKKDLTIYALVSLFPLATTLFAVSFGIVTYRYEKGFIYFGLFGVLFLYFASIMLLSKQPFIAIPSIFSAFFILSIFYFYKKIIKKY
ncbi:MAG: YjgP/YjgQ family permease [Campylobacteraceae bacterium]|nr:YjgP/YjgQ family permease [Campylobacteraceae bacterium]